MKNLTNELRFSFDATEAGFWMLVAGLWLLDAGYFDKKS